MSTVNPSDLLEIHQLYARYTHMLDTAREAEWADCFVPDGEFRIPARGIEVRGTASLCQFGRDYAAKVNGTERHVTTNILIETTPQAGQYVGRAYLIMVVGDRDTGRVRALGTYEDTIVQVDGQWKFSRRVLNYRVAET